MVHTPPYPPVGRGELLADARTSLAGGGSVLLWGPTGIGKSTILDAVAAEPSRARVLRAAPAEAESELPYLALVDLFGGALDEQSATLPDHLKVALDGALLRSALPATPHDQLAVRLAVLELLRGLAAREPVLLIVDDVQWLDEPSVGVLRFVARRVDGTAIRMLAAERVADGALPTRADLCVPTCRELRVPPLPEAGVSDLLRMRFGALPRAWVGRLYAASGGNPLMAIELARALRSRGPDTSAAGPLPVPDRLRGLLAARIADLTPAAQRALLIAAAAVRPSVTLLRGCDVDPDVELVEAARAGVVTIDSDGGVRFTHPLLREMVYADSDAVARWGAHERLAAAVSDPVERARHLAHAQPDPDETLAATLASAAAVARLRGAPDSAAELAVLAAERTPPDAGGTAAVRRLAAAEYALAAGAPADAHRHATAALRDAVDRRTRVGARLLLVELAGQDKSKLGPLLEAAFCDAVDGSDQLARVRFHRAAKYYYDGDREAALAELKRAEEGAEQCGDSEAVVDVLCLRGEMHFGPERDELFEQAGQLARGLPLTSAVVNARQLAAMACAFRGDIPEAVRRIEALRVAVERAGTVRDLAGVLISVAGVYWRAGRCGDVLTAGRYCVRLITDVDTTPGPGLLVGAMSEFNAGDLAQALEYAEQAVQASRAAGDDDWLKAAYAAHGMMHLHRGDAVAAVDVLGRAWEIEQRLGRFEPGTLLWHADYIEALVATGSRAKAAQVLQEVRSQAHRLGRTVTGLGLARAEALLHAAAGDPREAAEVLAATMERLGEHPYPMETARAWYVLGTLERRAHRRGTARAALTEAANRYAAAGAVNWQRLVEAELARLHGGRGAGLSPTERRIVELVRTGATNREIAKTLFLSIKAVEANLTRLYRRLGVRNRAQLAEALESLDLMV